MNVRELCSSCVFCCKKHVVGLKNFRLRGYSLTPKSRLSGAAKTSGYEHMRYLVVAPLICTALGTWQVARLKQKLEIIDKIQTRYHSDPVHLSEVHLFDGDTIANSKSLEYTRVYVRGKFEHEQEMYVDFKHPIKGDQSQWTLSTGSKASKGNYGAHVVTPFIVDDDDARLFNVHSDNKPLRILVNRGWVSKTQVQPQKRQKGQIEGSVTISGFVRADEKKFLNFLIQDTDKPRTYLFRDVPAMAQMSGTEAVMIELDSDSGVPNVASNEAPLPGQTLIQIYNKHVEYIATWYGLALVTGYLWYRHVYKAIPFSRKLFNRKMIK